MKRKRIILILLALTVVLVLLLACLVTCRHGRETSGNTEHTSASGSNEHPVRSASPSAPGSVTPSPENITPSPDKATPTPEKATPFPEHDDPENTGTGSPANTTPENGNPEDEKPGNNSPGNRTPVPGRDSGGLRVVGTQLSDTDGNPVQLRGISTHGIAWYPDYINKACFRELHDSWNVNVIRLAMYTAEYGGYCTGGSQAALKELISSGVDYATELNMYVIIDWHILTDGNPNTYKSEAIAFFDEMSKKYADNHNILYEICNEPNGGTSWQEIKSYAEDVIPVIRANDPDAVILVGTPNWCQFVDQAAADPITGYDNIMYTLHFYADTHVGLREKMESAVRAGLPIFVSEFGPCDASGNGKINREEAALWIRAMDRLGVSYVAWNLSNKEETAGFLKASCTKKSGFGHDDLSNSGHWLYEMLTGKAMPADPSAGQPPAPGTTENPAPAQTPEPEIIVRPDWSALLVNSWESGGRIYYQYTLTLTNNTGISCTKWTIEIEFEGTISLSDGWNGDYSVNGNTVRINSKAHNGAIPAGGTVSDIGFIVCGAGRIKS